MKFLLAILLLNFVRFSINQEIGEEIQINYERNSGIHYLFDVVIRDLMRTGDEDTGFPVMSPWKIEQINLNSSMGFIALAGDIRSMITLDMDKYLITNINFDSHTNRMNFDFSWSNLKSNGWYSVDGAFAGLIPIYGEGKFEAEVFDFRANGIADIETFGSQNHLNMTNINAKMRLGKLKTNIQGILGGGELGELLNVAFQDLMTSSLRQFESIWSDELKKLALPYINKFLNSLTMNHLLQRSKQN